MAKGKFTDGERLGFYLTYRGEKRGSKFIKFEMRVIAGDDPTMKEWRKAIDAAMLAAGLKPQPVETITMAELAYIHGEAVKKKLRDTTAHYGDSNFFRVVGIRAVLAAAQGKQVVEE